MEDIVVADPKLMNPVGIKQLSGELSNRIFRFAADLDASSMYPSSIRAYNITPEAEMCTIKVKDTVNDEEVDKTGEFVDHYLANDPMLFCQKYMNLPTIEQMEEFIAKKKAGNV